MKKSTRNLFFAFMLMGAGFFTNEASAKQPHNLNEAIITRLKADTMPAEDKAVVFVSFSIDKNGNVAVLELNGSDKSYVEYVKANLQDMNLSQYAVEEGKTYCYKISFNKV